MFRRTATSRGTDISLDNKDWDRVQNRILILVYGRAVELRPAVLLAGAIPRLA
jgi:hypothetical protein